MDLFLVHRMIEAFRYRLATLNRGDTSKGIAISQPGQRSGINIPPLTMLFPWRNIVMVESWRGLSRISTGPTELKFGYFSSSF